MIELREGVCYTDKKYPQKLQMLLREYLRKAGGLDGRENLYVSRICLMISSPHTIRADYISQSFQKTAWKLNEKWCLVVV